MALIKAVATDFGVPAGYWLIARIQEDILGRTLDVALNGYFDEVACRAGKKPMAAWSGRLAGELYQQAPSLAALYRRLTRLPDWADASDDSYFGPDTS